MWTQPSLTLSLCRRLRNSRIIYYGIDRVKHLHSRADTRSTMLETVFLDGWVTIEVFACLSEITVYEGCITVAVRVLLVRPLSTHGVLVY